MSKNKGHWRRCAWRYKKFVWYEGSYGIDTDVYCSHDCYAEALADIDPWGGYGW